MPHFFINSKQINNSIITINDKENYHHIARVLRARAGEKLMLIDENRLQYDTLIEKITNKEILCRIISSTHSNRSLGFDLYLAQSPLRSNSQLTVMEKSTELGAKGVYPIITDNCAVAKSVMSGKKDKWQKVMYEASKQCERAEIPTCYDITILEDVLDKNFDKILVLAERSAEISLKEYLVQNKIHKGESVLAVIGPEGGFSDREFGIFKSRKLPLITLGNLILKADTAVVVTLGNIIYEYQG